MAPRKKRKKHVSEPKAPKVESEHFNPAFGRLAALKEGKRSGAPLAQKEEPVEKGPEVDDAHFFLEAMADVEPLNPPKKKVVRPPDMSLRPAHPTCDDELEVMAHLSDLVSGIAEMDITFSDEYIEGSVQGFSRNLMRRLKRGQFPIQDHVDLHGLTKEEAKTRVWDFLLRSYRQGLRCVLVVHGRGLNSENHIPVLKERLPVWLARGPVRKIVLAFSTARPYDGGTGAVYILLKRRKT
jgi:DNA-nicking Smr family endonuclease